MAFVDPTQDPEAENQNQSQVDQALQATQTQQQNQQADNSPPTTTGGGGAGVVSAGSGALTPAPSKSGSWTNINSYLAANSDQGAGLGQTIAGAVDAQGNQAQNDINTLGSGFNQAVQGATVNQDQNAVNSAITGAQGLKAGQSLDDNTLNAFNAQKNANYGGPTDVTQFAGYGTANQDVNNATTAANQTTSEAGRNTLLQNQFQNTSENGYTQGENNLDQLLLENSPGGKAALQPLQSKWANLNSALGNTVTTGNTAAQQGAETTAATAQTAADAATKAQQQYESNLNNQTQSQWAATQALINQYKTQQLANTLTPEELAASGLQNGQQVYNTNLQNYINQTTPTAQTAANLDQYAQDAALSKLSGQNGMLNDTSQAGTANMGLFDKSLTPALQQANTAYQTNYNSPGLQIPFNSPFDGEPQDLNSWFQQSQILLQPIAQKIGGLPDGASPADLESKWIPALQQLSQRVAASGGNETYTNSIISQIQSAVNNFKQQQGAGNVIVPPLSQISVQR